MSKRAFTCAPFSNAAAAVPRFGVAASRPQVSSSSALNSRLWGYPNTPPVGFFPTFLLLDASPHERRPTRGRGGKNTLAEGRIVKKVKPSAHERHMRTYDAVIDKKLDGEAATGDPVGSIMMALPRFRTGGTASYRLLLEGLFSVTARGFSGWRCVGDHSFYPPPTASVLEPMRRAAAERERERAVLGEDSRLGAGSGASGLCPEMMQRLFYIIRSGADRNAAYRTCWAALSRTAVSNERLLDGFVKLMAQQISLITTFSCRRYFLFGLEARRGAHHFSLRAPKPSP